MSTNLYLLHHAALACTACMGAADDAQTNGMNAAILFLLGVTGVVLSLLAGGAGFIVWRAARQAPADAEAMPGEETAWTS
ncbi:MAG: hypothetical protein GC168_07940 [Candidatus Hydrogenedens sp.]|nr:hypothetical protein [Candidatus Hydrogenedens sp.]